MHPTLWELFSKSGLNRTKFEVCKYTFLIDLAPNEHPIGAEKIGKV